MFLKNFVLRSGAATAVRKATSTVRCSPGVSAMGTNQLRSGAVHFLQTCQTRPLSSVTRVPLCSADYRHHHDSLQCRTFTEDSKPTALTLIKDLKHLRSSPLPALVLGVAGAVPFAGAPAYMIFSGTFLSSIAFSQVAYGACILSFLGGVRWGLTVSPNQAIQPDWFNLGYSVAPSLVAWVGLMLPTSASVVLLITGLLGSCYMDVTMYGYPPWFKALRFLLTFLAVLSLWTTLMCRLLMAKDKKKKKIVKEIKPTREKSSWFRLPWKASEPKHLTEVTTADVPAEPIKDLSAKTEEEVVATDAPSK